ncbi:hypothetical protein AA21952_3423 [Acetobacter oeni LMG 21952]|nr:hypothetical protein AA21952_3423 [Acetobacter oeni LMG 21952]
MTDVAPEWLPGQYPLAYQAGSGRQPECQVYRKRQEWQEKERGPSLWNPLQVWMYRLCRTASPPKPQAGLWLEKWLHVRSSVRQVSAPEQSASVQKLCQVQEQADRSARTWRRQVCVS